MIGESVVLLALLCLTAGFASRGGEISERASIVKRSSPYQGPPAPLNHDGTVTYTPEFQEASAIHNAAYAHEFQRLQEVESLAAAYPDLTSPKSEDYNIYIQHQDTKEDDDGQYKPHLFENEQHHYPGATDLFTPYHTQGTSNNQKGQLQWSYNPVSYTSSPGKLFQASYTEGSSTSKQAHIPAPLNPDGTVAQTPEYNAIAASLQNAYHQAGRRHRRSIDHYQGPQAPLNHDGTVAYTPEFQEASAIHNAAYAHEFKRLQEVERLAAAHPDLTSPKSQDYSRHNQQYDNGQDDGQYISHLYGNEQNYETFNSEEERHVNYSPMTSHYNQRYYQIAHGKQAQVPAPLNPDGTVAHTPEFNSIAASLQNAYHQAGRRYRRSVGHYRFVVPAPLNHDGTVANTPEVQQAIHAHKAAYAQEHLILQHQEQLAGSHPDLTSVSDVHHGSGDLQFHDGYDYAHIGDEYNHNQYSTLHHNQPTSYHYNPEAHIPAPLNHDGTVSHTPEYQAIAAHHHAEYEKALHDSTYQTNRCTAF